MAQKVWILTFKVYFARDIFHAPCFQFLYVSPFWAPEPGEYFLVIDKSFWSHKLIIDDVIMIVMLVRMSPQDKILTSSFWRDSRFNNQFKLWDTKYSINEFHRIFFLNEKRKTLVIKLFITVPFNSHVVGRNSWFFFFNL